MTAPTIDNATGTGSFLSEAAEMLDMEYTVAADPAPSVATLRARIAELDADARKYERLLRAIRNSAVLRHHFLLKEIMDELEK